MGSVIKAALACREILLLCQRCSSRFETRLMRLKSTAKLVKAGAEIGWADGKAWAGGKGRERGNGDVERLNLILGLA